MLFVFLVDIGTMCKFDMRLVTDSVSALQKAISEKCGISVDKQVLLISGGENLDPSARVCSYSAGTDTNPIYLFSKSTIESANPPSPSLYISSDRDLKAQVEGLNNMPATYDTVVSRVQLALQFQELASEEMKCCEVVVHDQHQQQQGWAAVVCNLEDITSAFKQRSLIFKQSVEDFLQCRDHYIEMLTNFPQVLTELARIPVLTCLREEETQVSFSSSSSGSELQQLTLLQWINIMDRKTTLQQMAEQCIKNVEQFNDSLMNDILGEVQSVLEKVENTGMKEIRGLSDRLFGLEQLMAGAKKIEKEQYELAQGFVQNQERVRNLKDASVLPDLCVSHQKQLVHMLQNHSQLRDIRRRCSLAKEELSVNLHTRLRWIMYVEKQISDTDSKQVIYHENLKRLKRWLNVTEQIYEAPSMYLSALVEVYQRKIFTKKYLEWTEVISDESTKKHSEEVERRRKFSAKMSQHFLKSLFPGLDEYPPSFASELPEPYDKKLPNVTMEDIDNLRTTLPKMQEYLRFPDNYESFLELHGPETKVGPEQAVEMVVSSTLSRSFEKLGESETEVTVNDELEVTIKNATEAGRNLPEKVKGEESRPSLPLHFEDHEQFESALQSFDQGLNMDLQQLIRPLDMQVPGQEVAKEEFQSAVGESCDDPVQLQSKLQECVRILTTLKSGLQTLRVISNRTVFRLREDVASLKSQVNSSRQELDSWIATFVQDYESAAQKCQAGVKEQYEQWDGEQRDRVQTLVLETQNLRSQLESHQQQLHQAENQLAKLRRQSENDIMELSQQLGEQHGLEIVRLREECDNRAKEMEEDIRKKEKVIMELALDKDQLERDLQDQIELRCAKLREEHTIELEARQGQLEAVHQSQVELIREESEKKWEETVHTLREQLVREREDALKRVEEELTLKHEKSVEELQVTWESQKNVELEEIKRQLILKHQEEFRSQKERVELEKSEYYSAGDLEKKPEDRQALPPLRMEKSFNTDKESDILAAVEAERQQHQQEMMLLCNELEEAKRAAVVEALELERKKHQETLETQRKEATSLTSSLKTNKQAEKQVQFNQVIAKATAEKERVINELREKEQNLLKELEELKGTIASLVSSRTDITEELQQALQQSINRERKVLEGQESLAAKLREAEDRASSLQQRISSKYSRQSSVEPVEPVPQPASSTSVKAAAAGEGEGLQEVVYTLKKSLKAKEDECHQLNQKLIQITSRSSSRAEKIAIQDFSVGDIVLMCFDEEHNNYILFTIGSILYFVHSESVASMGLSMETKGAKRKLWTLGQITDKEYCQAKKELNRFNVAIGTKFYRVKTSMWPQKMEK